MSSVLMIFVTDTLLILRNLIQIAFSDKEVNR